MDGEAVLSILSDIARWGLAGLIVLGFLTKWLVPGWTYRDKADDADAWKGLYESERTAHEHTREAMAIQGERLQVAVESAKVTEELLREARGRVVPPSQAV